MLFIETEIFTEDVKKLLDDDEYRRLQIFLAIQPDCGDLESGSQIKYRHWFLLFEFGIVRKMYYTPLTYS